MHVSQEAKMWEGGAADNPERVDEGHLPVHKAELWTWPREGKRPSLALTGGAEERRLKREGWRAGGEKGDDVGRLRACINSEGARAWV